MLEGPPNHHRILKLHFALLQLVSRSSPAGLYPAQDDLQWALWQHECALTMQVTLMIKPVMVK